jgi:hypothetical protein
VRDLRPPPSAAADPAVLYLHIPKTAGTSMRHLLEAHYRAAERVYLYRYAPGIPIDDFLAMPEAERSSARLIFGHFQYGLHDSLPQRSRYVTMLRHPVARVGSLYHHYRNHRGKFHDAARELSLDDFIQRGLAMGMDNGMVRQIAGVRGTRFGECSREHLEAAKLHIEERFDAALIYESMEQSLTTLGQVLGRRLQTPHRVNVGGRTAPDPESRELIERVNALDLELYHWVRQRLESGVLTRRAAPA